MVKLKIVREYDSPNLLTGMIGDDSFGNSSDINSCRSGGYEVDKTDIIEKSPPETEFNSIL